MPSPARPRLPRAFITAWNRWIRTNPPCSSVLEGDEAAPEYRIGVLVQQAATAIYAAGVTVRNGKPGIERYAAAAASLAALERVVAKEPDAMPVVDRWCGQSRELLDLMPVGGRGGPRRDG